MTLFTGNGRPALCLQPIEEVLAFAALTIDSEARGVLAADAPGQLSDQYILS